MRIINNRRFEPGPFSLGRFGPYIGSVAVVWVVFITVSIHIPAKFLDLRPLYEQNNTSNGEWKWGSPVKSNNEYL